MTDYNSIMDDDNDIEDDYDLDDDDMDDDGSERGPMSNGRKKIIAAVAGLGIIAIVAFALSFFAGDSGKTEAPTLVRRLRPVALPPRRRVQVHPASVCLVPMATPLS